jgi:voltage-gated potassium channel
MINTKDWKVINALVIVLMWIFLGTFIFWNIENWTLIDSFYFSVSSLTTVGYGDLTPSSQFGKLVAALYILFGVGIVLASLGFIGREFLSREEMKLKRSYSRQNKQKDDVVTSEIESVRKILQKNTNELKEQAEIIERDEKKIKSAQKKVSTSKKLNLKSNK